MNNFGSIINTLKKSFTRDSYNDSKTTKINLNLPANLLGASHWDDLISVLLDISFLEAKAQAGLVFELATDFSKAVHAMPVDHPQRQTLQLIRCALGADLQFIAKYPSTLFQCLWNRCWWHDCSASTNYFEQFPPVIKKDETEKQILETSLAEIMQGWLQQKQQSSPQFYWLRSLRPPSFSLNSSQLIVFRSDFSALRSATLSSNNKQLFAWFAEAKDRELLTPFFHIWDLCSGRERHFSKKNVPVIPDTFISANKKWRLHQETWQPIRLCHAINGKVIQIFSTPNDGDENFSGMAFSPDSKWVAGGSYGAEGCVDLYVWDTLTGNLIFSVDAYQQGTVWALAFSPDSQFLASGHSNGGIQIWSVRERQLIGSLNGHEGVISTLSYSENGQKIISGSSWDHTIRIWDVTSMSTQTGRVLKGHKDSIQELVFSTNGNRLATRSPNQTLWLWNGSTGSSIAPLYQSTSIFLEGGGCNPSILMDESRVVHLSVDGIKTWDIKDGNQLNFIPIGGFTFSTDITFSPDGHSFLSLRNDQFYITYFKEAGIGEQIHFLDGNITAITITPDAQRIISGSKDAIIKIWDAKTGSEITHLKGHTELITSLAVSSDGGRIVSTALDKTIRTWDAITGAQLSQFHVVDPGVWSSTWSIEKGQQVIQGLASVSFSSDGLHVISLSRIDINRIPPKKMIGRIWDPITGECLQTIQGINELVAMAGKPYLATYRKPELLEIISTETNEVIARYPITLESVKVHPSGDIWAGNIGKYLYHFKLEQGCPTDLPKPRTTYTGQTTAPS